MVDLVIRLHDNTGAFLADAVVAAAAGGAPRLVVAAAWSGPGCRSRARGKVSCRS
jgi:hypothetical protein